jgi:hypothetical protein
MCLATSVADPDPGSGAFFWTPGSGECMHRRLIIKKTWLSALSYAQSRISMVFCRSLSFLVPWFSFLLIRFGGFFVICKEKKPTLFLKHMYCVYVIRSK